MFAEELVTDPDGKGPATGNAAHMGATIIYTRRAILNARSAAFEGYCHET